MFESIYKVLEDAQKLDQDEIAYDCYFDEDFQTIVINSNRIGQLTAGEDVNGGIVGTYSPNTDIMSEGLTFSFEGQTYEKIVGEPYNFVDSGDFFRSFRIIVQNDGFIIYANDQKVDGSLSEKFDAELLGLNDENINKMVDALLPIFIRETRRVLLG